MWKKTSSCHNKNVQNNPTVRLINPAENELGKISRVILDKIIKNIRESLQLNQWKNIGVVTDWFIAIQYKNLHSFVNFDIKYFYPSINGKLLIKTLKYAEAYTNISDEDKCIISHSKKIPTYQQLTSMD